MSSGAPTAGTVLDRVLVLLAATALTVLAHTLAEGSGPGGAEVVWAPGATYGVSLADLPIAALWGLGFAACTTLLGSARPVRPLAVVAVVLTVLTATLVKGDGPGSGRTVLVLHEGYGVNRGDVAVLVVWAVGLGCCGGLWRRSVASGPRT